MDHRNLRNIVSDSQTVCQVQVASVPHKLVEKLASWKSRIPEITASGDCWNKIVKL